MKAAITRAITELDAVPEAARRGVPVIETLFVAFERGESIASQRSFRLTHTKLRLFGRTAPVTAGPADSGR
jgi:hypothetical protein